MFKKKMTTNRPLNRPICVRIRKLAVMHWSISTARSLISPVSTICSPIRAQCQESIVYRRINGMAELSNAIVRFLRVCLFFVLMCFVVLLCKRRFSKMPNVISLRLCLKTRLWSETQARLFCTIAWTKRMR